MKLRRSHLQLVLFLPLAQLSFALDTPEPDSTALVPREAGNGIDANAVLNVQATISPSKPDVGTKDAPVDGLDGKPHAGPYIDKQKKPKPGVEDIGPKPASAPESVNQKLAEETWKLGPENDGVMFHRDPSPEGPTGTEGGVSKKDKERKEKEDKSGERSGRKPDPPKEAPPLPVHEEEVIGKETTVKLSEDKEKPKEKPKGATGLEKPADLPDKPHDIPHPDPPTLPKSDNAINSDTKPATTKPFRPPTAASGDDDEGIIQPLHSFILSLTMIIFSEIGDKTFLVAALMAMRHPRMVVFSAALSALTAMTILSAVLGHAVPTLLSKRLTSLLATILFLVFGVRLLREGLAMSPDEGVGEEMKEVEMELEEKEHLARRSTRRPSEISPYALESGRGRRSESIRLPTHPRSPSSSPSRSPSPSPRGLRGSVVSAFSGLNNLLGLLLSPAWVQTFIMTFLGEWGDRSQIATIAMAAGQDYWWVTGGAIIGHAACTAAAVIGGRAIAGKVSMRVVTLGGATAFIVFGLIYLVETAYSG
ncbi:UPF0016-domain-containing protein [Eremomyces bilateralis CBS 781.70]|uniref:UPF0016-domain-containing protein n=1 Tax=Eremomyces bilateralis CBS 781.70 TaxID=1392243 RepID=A0A6G1G4P6_9PEZI|nr:UPF0016-domain-containing protein [Eremomyces bilateralis CBS 781.70]KAF1812972.1 UPF0016-domain-containing protein [Eremomyces bilateralis CBS 781.70]